MLPLTALHNGCDVVDNIAAFLGNNNYQAHQVLVEVWYGF